MNGESAVQQASRAKPVRVALWDNAKFVIIALVVISHMLGTIRTQTETAFGVYTFSFFIHMPVILLIAGYFSKAHMTPRLVNSIVQLVAVWVGWESLWAVIRYFGEDEALKSDFLISPAWTLWFLVSLATMRALLPLLSRARFPVLLSFVIALAAGLSPEIGIDFSASRTLCFLPFFMVGWAARERGLLQGEWFVHPTKTLRAIAWSFISAVAAFFVFASPLEFWRLDTWLRWRDSYFVLFEDAPIGGFSPDAWWSIAGSGMALRFALIVLQFAMLLAVLIIVSRRTSIVTTWGSRTLYVYLLHAPMVWVIRQTGFIDSVAAGGVAGLIALMAIGVAIAVALSSRWVSTLTRPFVEPKISWLMKPTEARPRAGDFVSEFDEPAFRQDMTALGRR